jgi:pyruvate-formate lyase-activating enzyme
MGRFFAAPTVFRLARSLLTKDQPIYVQYYVTARCNLACEQCNVIYSNADVHEATAVEAGAIAANLAAIGVSVVLLTGGEPFARNDLPRIVRAFVDRGIHVRLQTNGLATRERIAECVDAGANDISISLDTLQPDLQDTINGRVADSWRRAIRSIAHVAELFPDEAFAVFGCVLAPRNFRHVPDVIRFATEIGWWVSLVPAHATAHRQPLSFRAYDPALAFPRELWDEVDAVLDEVHRLREGGFHLYDSDPYLDDMRRMIRGQPVTWRDRNGGVCDSPNLYFAILPSGEMAVCCDWRLRSSIHVASPDFPERFRDLGTRDEVHGIATGCSGCLFGSFPEITISTRYLGPMLRRMSFFGTGGARRRLRRLSAAELEQVAGRIRAASPHLYTVAVPAA